MLRFILPQYAFYIERYGFSSVSHELFIVRVGVLIVQRNCDDTTRNSYRVY